MDQLIILGFPLFLLLLSYFIGRHLESNHYKSIREREAATKDMVAVNFPRFPFDVEIERAGMVMGSVVVSHDHFKRFLAQLRIIVGGRIKSYEPLLDRARREAVLRMKEQALARGHNTVVNIRLETSRLANSRRGGKGTAGVEMLAYGTALTVREGL
ncbi:uncharacterized protein METZ01_LOCUS213720 [marine metagenome]|uniref:YbjQ family protein n=1 Tax=marine metagenome TaxID=408172 RepID=A0A382FCQ0_9ZZZZ